MYSTCPKGGRASAAENLAGRGECPACGLIFKKWMAQRFRPPTPAPAASTELATDGLVIWSIWFFKTDHRELWGHLPEINSSIMHSVNLAFHEAAHMLLGAQLSIDGGLVNA